MRRAQLPMALLEAAIGVVLVMGVALGFGLGVAGPDPGSAQLEVYAADGLVLLADEPPRHVSATRLAEVISDGATFDREADALERRLSRILPDNLMYRLSTPQGAVGQPVPSGVRTGVARKTTAAGVVELRVWYA